MIESPPIDTLTVDTPRAVQEYEAIRHVLPTAQFPTTSHQVDNLAAVAADIDAFILDAYGVLNRGESPVPGGPGRMADLRTLGKKMIVLTNAASYSRDRLMAKYTRLGYDFGEDEVVSSRDVAFAGLPALPSGQVWGAISTQDDDFSDAPVPVIGLGADAAPYDRVGGFLFLSSNEWSEVIERNVLQSLKANPRPLIVANPDLVAPCDGFFSIEPGWRINDMRAALPNNPIYYGKPFANAFEAALARLPNIPRNRIAMVGDTLHTDVIGGAAAGIRTVLITDHGLFRGHDVVPYITETGIRPDWIARTT